MGKVVKKGKKSVNAPKGNMAPFALGIALLAVAATSDAATSPATCDSAVPKSVRKAALKARGALGVLYTCDETARDERPSRRLSRRSLQ